MFAPARNQALLNQCSSVITMGWMANTDVQPCVTLQALLKYISKYVSKPEKKSLSYTELQAQILPYTNSRAPLLSFVSKMLNKLIGERDWSAQEVSHILLGLPLQESSRHVVTLDCRPEEVQNDAITVDDETITVRKSPLQRYQTRMKDQVNSALAELTLFEWLRAWNWYQWTERPRAQARVINYFPRYSSLPSSPDFEDYCRVRLMLHHPFESFADLFSFDGQTYGSYADAFRACEQLHSHPEDFYTDPLDEHDNDEDSESEDEDAETDIEPLASFEAFARRGPRNDLTCSITDELGLRDIDRAYDWTQHVGRDTTTPEDWAEFKAANETEQAVDVDSDPSLLNTEQRRLYDTVTDQYIAELASYGPRQLLLNVDGAAGTGKTFVLLKICARLQELARQAREANPVFRGAPTGVAAFNIVGRTLHSLFRLPVKQKTADLSPATLQSLQAQFQNVKFLIIDEKSMIDLKMLSIIDDRLRLIFPDKADQAFGGLNLLLCGDFYQLPPVTGWPLYASKPQGAAAIKGQGLYRSFGRTIRLTQVMRQHGEDETTVRFRTALQELRDSNVSRDSWTLLCTRVQNQLAPDEAANFRTALRLYFTNEEVRERNYNQLAAANRPVKKISALHTGRNASKAPTEDANGLTTELLVCIGAQVMLTSNLWTEKGLVNGSIGTVTDILWKEGLDPSVSMPSLLLVHFAEYSGPDFPLYGPKIVPVFSASAQFDFKSASCTRIQFPLRLAYAITVHKSQGLTLSKVVLNIDQKEHCSGLTYVAVSRVKALQGLMFECAFDFSRFTRDESVTVRDRELDIRVRNLQLIQ